MKEITKPTTLKDIKGFSAIKMGEYIPSTGKRVVTQFDILPNAVFYRKDVFTPLNKNFKRVTKMGHLTQREMCDSVNKLLQSANSRIKAVLGYTGGVTLHGQRVSAPTGKSFFGDLPEIPEKLRKLLKL